MPEQYPEHQKLTKISNQSQAIGEFIEWASAEKGLMLGEHVAFDGRSYETFVPSRTPIQDLLAEFFEIDQAKLEQEKRAMLEAIRNG